MGKSICSSAGEKRSGWGRPVRLVRTAIVGEEAAAGLQWLERTAGEPAVRKFLGGKLRGTRLAGEYLIGLTDQATGREVICALLTMLRDGQAIPLCDVVSYYAHGKRWALGMAIHAGQLVDVWAGSEPQAATGTG